MNHPQTDRGRGRDLTVGSIPRHLVVFSLPMLVGNLIQTGYSLVNAFWVGKRLGENALAAVTVSFPVIFVLTGLAMGLTMATSILVAQFAGGKEWHRLRKTVQTSTLVVIGVSIILVIIGMVTAPVILKMMNTPDDIYDMAVSYLRVFLLSEPFSFGLFLLGSMLRGIGDSVTPLYFQMAALVLTAIFDPILMLGWWFFPHFGLNGTAIASLVMQGLALVAMSIYLRQRKSIVVPDWLKLSIDPTTFWLTLKIGLPAVVQQSLVALGAVFVTGIINKFGKDATAAFGAAGRIDQIAFMPAMTFSSAVATLVGQNVGARQLNRVKEAFWWSILLCGGITLAVSALAVSQPHLLLSMFLQEPKPIEIGVRYLQIVGSCYVFFAVMFVGNGVLNGSGHTMITTVISLVSLWATRVPLALYLVHKWNRVEAVWWAMATSLAISMLISLAFFFSGYWKRPVVKHGPAGEMITPPEEFVTAATPVE